MIFILTFFKYEIGYVDYVKTATQWNNLHEKVLVEADPIKQAVLRRQSAASDYTVATVDALTEDGQFVVVDFSGSRVSSVTTAGKVILVVGANKIVPNLEVAEKRVHEYTWVLESARARKAYGVAASQVSNYYICKTQTYMPKRYHLIIVNQSLGY